MTVAATQISARNTMLITAVVALVLAISIAALITMNLLGTLGGEPAYAAQILHSVASGRLDVNVQTKAGDQSSMLYAVSNMVAKLNQVIAEVNSATDAPDERGGRSQHDGAVAVAGFKRTGGGRRGDERVDRSR